MTAISQKSRFWGHPQKRLCIARKFCVRFSSLFALILRIAFLFVRKRQVCRFSTGKNRQKRKTHAFYLAWLAACPVRILPLTPGPGAVRENHVIQIVASGGKILHHFTFLLSQWFCLQYSTFRLVPQEAASKFHKQFTYFCAACEARSFLMLAQFSTSPCGNWRNHGESMGFPSLFPCSLYIFSLAFGMLPML